MKMQMNAIYSKGFFLHHRTYFGAKSMQKRISDCSDSDDEDGSEQHVECRQTTRRKATDILAEVHVRVHVCKCKWTHLKRFERNLTTRTRICSFHHFQPVLCLLIYYCLTLAVFPGSFHHHPASSEETKDIK